MEQPTDEQLWRRVERAHRALEKVMRKRAVRPDVDSSGRLFKVAIILHREADSILSTFDDHWWMTQEERWGTEELPF